MADSSSYDDVPYDSVAYPQTQPDRLSVLATLFALETTLPSRARVLDIGCAAGGNLIPLAQRYPEARFTGLDLSRRQIDDGRRDVEALGLRNVELLERNLMDVDESLGRFDYIIAHGVFSWIPAPARRKLLDICRANLTAAGIAYVSYNTFPGWRLRGVVRDMMRYHAGPLTDPRQRTAQARAMLEFLQTSLAKQTNAYAAVLREESRSIAAVADSYLLHEHLEEENEPVYFHQFFEQAAAAGLTYVCEEELAGSAPEIIFAPEIADTVRRVARDLVSIEQYTDFLTNRSFRQSLLVSNERVPDRVIAPERVMDLFVASNARPEAAKADLRSAAMEKYRTGSGGSVSLSQPITKVALEILNACWPETLAFDVLRARASAALGRPAADAADAKALAGDLFSAFTVNAVALHREPPPATSIVSQRPAGFAPARHYASRGLKRLPNARHYTVDLEDFDLLLLRLLDGSRDIAALVDVVVEQIRAGKLVLRMDAAVLADPAQLRKIVAGVVGKSLHGLKERAFLVG